MPTNRQLSLFNETSCCVCGKVLEQIETITVYYFDDDETSEDVVCGEQCRIDFFLKLMREGGAV